MVSSLLRLLLVALALTSLAHHVGEAQQRPPVPVHAELWAGGEMESYLRTLQVAGMVPLYPWSVRGFSQRELGSLAPDSVHPWVGRYTLEPPSAVISFSVVQPQGELDFNSAYPYGINNGPRWSGKGLTAAARFGFAGRVGPVTLSVVPEAFIAQNLEFELLDNGYEGLPGFADARLPTLIDQPQRFGEGAYGRIDPGESGIRIDLPVVAAGVSTGSQFWGPAVAHPVLLGNNAGGFLHAFLGTSEPVDLWIGRVHGRMVWGDLRQSDYTVPMDAPSRRFMAGMVGVFVPRGAPGLEIGAGRFFHAAWPEAGPSLNDLLRPLEGLLKEGRNTGQGDNSSADNQLASVFARWVIPGSGFEIYGEFGREDHSWNSRDLLLEPDHISAYMLGFRRVWEIGGGELLSLRGEMLNSQVSHLAMTRWQSPFYVHNYMRQGHTHRGQALGSAAAYGGAGGVLALDRFHDRGRWTLEASRLVRSDVAQHASEDAAAPLGMDVLYGLHSEALFFLPRFDLSARISAMNNLNRNFAGDRFNLGAAVGMRWRR